MKKDIRQLHKEFCIEAELKNYRPSTIAWWRQAFRMFLGHFPEGEIRRINDMDVERLRRYLYDKRLGGWTSHTFSNQYRALRAFLSWAVRKGYLDTNPLDAIERPRLERKLPKSITIEEARRVLEFAFHGPASSRFQRYRNRALLAVMLYAGLRSAETLALELGDIDFGSEAILVRCGKGAKDRLVPMNRTLRTYLHEYLLERERAGKCSAFLFTPVRQDQALARSGLRRMIDRLRGRCGIDFSPHRLRHTFATLMYEGGCSLYSLQKMMGHADIQTTTVYLSATASHLRSEIAKHPLG